MWKKLMAAAVISAVMCVLSGGGVLAEVVDTMITKVSITFIDANYF